MARHRVELEPIDPIDMLKARVALRRGSPTVDVGRWNRTVPLREFIASHRDELARFAAADGPGAMSARVLLDAFERDSVR